MRHTIHIMYGVEFKEALLHLKEYLDKSGTPDIEKYCSAFLLEKGDDKLTIYEAIVQESEVPSITKRKTYVANNILEITAENQNFKLLEFLRDQARKRITQEIPGDYNQINIIIHAPLFLKNAFEDIEPLLKAATQFAVDIDILGFDEELKKLFITEEANNPGVEYENNVTCNISKFLEFAKQQPKTVNNILIWSNFIYTGVSLGISDIKSFVRVVGEFSLLCIENYESVFGNVEKKYIIHTFGIAMLNFDRFYFIEYMANRTYMSIMDNENINQESTNINLISSKSQKILDPLLAYFSNFYTNVVKVKIDTKWEKQNKKNRTKETLKGIIEEVNNEIDPIISAKIEEMKNTLIDYFDDNNKGSMSLPEKKALLATILGEDDELLVNNIFNNSPIIFDDIEGQFTEFFVELNNAIVENSETYPEIKDFAALSLNNEKVSCNLDEIKKLKLQIKRKSSYIRTLEAERNRYKQQISNQKEAKKTLIKDGSFVFDDQEYKLIPIEIEEKPLQETYSAHPTTAKSIDLRSSFPQINSQGQQGSCTAFALTSIYEYFFNLDNQKDCQLSQAFLYYNARKKRGDEGKDIGSAVSYAIETMTENGMCLNTIFPYNDQDYLTVPPQEAYDDGATRKVKKALNVNIALDDIKSALNDGYPVAISTTLYESFGSGYKGLISMPTKEEMEQGVTHKSHGRHAMVICGYNDDSKYFVVRNSWGTSFGDKGYCYMPYEYILNRALTSGLYVITEIALCKINILHNDKKHLVEFDVRDSELMYHITERSIENEIEEQLELQGQLDILKINNGRLKQAIKDFSNQELIKDGYSKLLELEHTKLIGEKRKKDIERAEKLQSILLVKPCLVAFITYLILAVAGWYLLPIVNYIPDKLFDNHFEGGITDGLLWSISWITILLITWAIINYIYNKRRRAVKEEYDELLIRLSNKIGSIDRERLFTPLKVMTNSTLLTKIDEVRHKLYTTLNITKSYLRNLQSWYKEMEQDRSEMDPSTQQPFTSLLSNKKIDEYFDNHKDEISKDIYLSKFVIDEYKLSEGEIIKFKQNLDSLIVAKIESIFADFRMDDYLLGQDYEYLEKLQNRKIDLLQTIDSRVNLFYPSNKFIEGLEPSKIIYINVKQDRLRNWQDMYPRAFTIKPGFVQLNSRFKLVLLKIQDIKLHSIKESV